MHVVYLDLTGAIFNNLQQLVMCAYDNKTNKARDEWTWGPLQKNPVKLLISLGSYIFCIIYLIQHHILFGAREPRPDSSSAFSSSRRDIEANGEDADYGTVVPASSSDQDNPRRNLLAKERA